MRAVLRTRPPQMGTEPPAKPVPAPRGVTGILLAAHIFMIAETSSVLSASQTASGENLP